MASLVRHLHHDVLAHTHARDSTHKAPSPSSTGTNDLFTNPDTEKPRSSVFMPKFSCAVCVSALRPELAESSSLYEGGGGGS